MNCCIFSGNLTRDPEIRQAGNGSGATLNFTIAVQVGYGENKAAMFIGCSAYGKEKLAQYLHKGSHVTVSGELFVREYQGKNFLNLRVRDLDLPPRTSGSHPQPQPQRQAEMMPEPSENTDSVPF